MEALVWSFSMKGNRAITLEMAWRGRRLLSEFSSGPLTPAPIREYNGLRGAYRGLAGLSFITS